MSQPDSTDNRRRLRKAWLSVSAAAIAIVLFFALVIVKPAMQQDVAGP